MTTRCQHCGQPIYMESRTLTQETLRGKRGAPSPVRKMLDDMELGQSCLLICYEIKAEAFRQRIVAQAQYTRNKIATSVVDDHAVVVRRVA